MSKSNVEWYHKWMERIITCRGICSPLLFFFFRLVVFCYIVIFSLNLEMLKC